MNKFTLLVIGVLALATQANSQCTPQFTYGPSAWAEPSDPTTPYTGFLCQGHDTIFTRTGWDFFDGDGYFINLIATSQVRITAYNVTTATSLTIVDSTGATGGLGVIIPGAFSAAASPNTLLFTAPYTGKYYIVFDNDGDCTNSGTAAAGIASVALINASSITNCIPFPPPVNDTICSAIGISLATLYAGNTTYANAADPLDANVIAAGYACSTPNNTLWYSYTAATTDNYSITTNSPASGGMDVWVGVFSGGATCNDPLTYIDCQQGAAVGGTATTVAALTAGTTYYFMVDGVNGSVGAFDLTLAVAGAGPVNDSICGALPLTINTMVTGSTVLASAADNDDANLTTLGYTCFALNNTVWYSYTPTVSDSVSVFFGTDVNNAPLPGWFGLISTPTASGTCAGPFTYEGCYYGPLNATASGSGATADPYDGVIPTADSSINHIFLTAGNTYYFIIDGVAGAFGDFTFGIENIITGIKTIEVAKDNSIAINPNPSKGLFILENNVSDKNQTLNVYDSFGKVVLSQSITDVKTNIDMSKFAKGVYTATVAGDKTSFTKRIVIN